ncbi:MAG: AAA family ATPase [Lentisphaerae bacterium]|nr:AAA family ATPase [Lentisphaerota bacterium]
MRLVKITLSNGTTHECAEGVCVCEFAGQVPVKPTPYIAALVNNDLVSMSYPLTVDSTVEFLTMADSHGWRVYRRSLCFLLAKVVAELFPKAGFSVEHSFGPGLYCSFDDKDTENKGISPANLKSIEHRMRELIAKNLPIERRKISYESAMQQFHESGQTDKRNLLLHRNPPRVVVHWCDGFQDLAHGPLAPTTGVLKHFALVRYEPGFVLHLPDKDNPETIPPFEDQPHLFKIFQEHKQWGRILQVSTVGRLNEIIANGENRSFIRTAEALHEKKVSEIADKIGKRQREIRVILIAGPSSAGKTTFAKRLSTHLAVNGLRPVTIATDNYFVGEDKNPLDEFGKPDYEHLDAVDIALFNNDLLKLIRGEKIEVPYFNFEKKQREYRDDFLHIDSDQIIIIEGIHGLNPRLTHMIPAKNKFRIYINALTQLSLDANNRISTTDNRLMRRIVRDNMFRGYSALETLRRWPSVRRGEKRWIFPFQREADVTFNSALDYELAILKPIIEPLLAQIKPADKEYAESRRLSEFLLNFLGASSDSVPGNSILREYIGGSDFEY